MYQQYRPNQFSTFPPVVKNLLIINGLCFLAYIVLQSRGWYDMNDHFGLYYPESSLFRPYQLLTHVFMHGTFMHLFFNMFSLWMFGSVLENHWGPKRFFIYYFITAFGAAALYLGINAYEVHQIKEVIATFNTQPDYDTFFGIIQKDSFFANDIHIVDFLSEWKKDPSNPDFVTGAKQIVDYLLIRKINVPVVGASGAVFGLLLGFGMLFPNTQLVMLFFPFPIKAKYFVLIYGFLELYQGISNDPSDNVAHFAHLGGMLFGFVMIKLWNKGDRKNFY